MAQVTQGAFFAVNGVELSPVLKTVAVKGNADILDATVLEDTVGRKYVKGLRSREITGEGFFKASSFSVLDANGLLQGAVTSQSGNYLALLGRSGTTQGNIAEMCNLVHASYEINETVGELLMATFAGNTSATATAGTYQVGFFVIDQTFTGAANGAGYDNSASSTGWLCQGHVTGGDGTVTLKLQHSTNNSTWADLYNIGTVPAATAFTSSSTTDAVNRYLRVICTGIGGTTADAVVAVKTGYTG